MKRWRRLTRRGLVRAVSFLTAAFVITAGLAVQGWHRAYELRRELGYARQHGYSELLGGLSAIEVALQKGLVSRSPAMTAALSAEVSRQAARAQSGLGALPLNTEGLSRSAAFLAQAGDYAHLLSRKAAAGEVPDAGERDSLRALALAAGQLSDQLTGAFDGTPRLPEERLLRVEQDFPDTPSLVYDGPFSAHLEQREAVFLAGQPEVTQEEAKRRAAAFLEISESQLTFSGTGGGPIATYAFTGHLDGGEVWIELSRRGGHVANLLNSRQMGDPKLTCEEAVRKARAFLTAQGYPDMKDSYWTLTGGGVLINFAYRQDGALCYPDLIKVCVALDTGRVTHFESVGYLMNHRPRNFPPDRSAALYDSSGLDDRGLCVIPSGGQDERFCRQFAGKDAEGRDYLVFVNASSGAEERILLLIEDETGTLAI